MMSRTPTQGMPPQQRPARPQEQDAQAAVPPQQQQQQQSSRPPVEARPRPDAPPAPQQGVSKVLLGILAVVVITAIAFMVWKFAIKKTDDTSNSMTEPPKPPITEPVKPPPPPPP